MEKLYTFTIFILIVAFTNSQTIPNESKFKQWATTPPMGWNSWDCFGASVIESEVKANADYMAKHLLQFGWEYIVVDIRWYIENENERHYNKKNPVFVIDEYGRYLPAVNRFPSAANGAGFKNLADYIHAKGLKFGIHLMRGVPRVAVKNKLLIKGTNGITADKIYSTLDSCKWLQDNFTILAEKQGAQEYYNSLFELYAAWGVDFVKIDDLSYPYHKDEINLIRKAIDNCGRPIVLSTSPGATPISEAAHISNNANMWRMISDFWDRWRQLSHLFQVCSQWYPYSNTGTWPDCDMLPLGQLAIRGHVGDKRMTKFTQDEQYTLMSLFTIFRSPLMFGGNLPSNDTFTLSLLTNKDVLKMHREGTNVRQLYNENGKVVITSKNEKTGETYLALFNISEVSPVVVNVKLSDLGITNAVEIINMWSGKNIGIFKNSFEQSINAHSSVLYLLK